jgi:hypothetical protein
VFWPRRVDCLYNEERQERQRIKQGFGLQPQVTEAIVRNLFLLYSDYPEGSFYQIIKQKGDYDDVEQTWPLGASRGDVLDRRLYLSPCDDRRHGCCQVRRR